MALCLHTATAADTISISVVPSSADPTVAVFTVNCPADGFNNEFVIYYGTTPGGVPASGVTQQAASAPLPCAGVTTVSFTYLQPGLFQVHEGSPSMHVADFCRSNLHALLMQYALTWQCRMLYHVQLSTSHCYHLVVNAICFIRNNI